MRVEVLRQTGDHVGCRFEQLDAVFRRIYCHYKARCPVCQGVSAKIPPFFTDPSIDKAVGMELQCLHPMLHSREKSNGMKSSR